MSHSLDPSSLGAVSMGDRFVFLARVTVALVFIYLGWVKTADPASFLKQLREFEFTEQPLLLNLVAAALPWFEVYCGVLLLAGVGTRSVATIFTVMLVGFTALVLNRALAIHTAEDIAFCAIALDCGCGSGEVNICKKLAQNAGLLACAFFAAIKKSYWLALKPAIFPRNA